MKGAHRVEIGKHERWADGRATWEEDSRLRDSDEIEVRMRPREVNQRSRRVIDAERGGGK